jgi:hypothetical protein
MPEQNPNEQITKTSSLPPQRPATSFAPKTLDEAIAFCKFLANSDLVPKDYRNHPENVFVAIQLGAELGIAPMQALSGIAVINGRGAVWGDLLLAIVQAHPAYEEHKEVIEGTGDARAARFEIKRKGQAWYKYTFSVADAKKAGLWEKAGPWKQYPDRMLQMRARGFGCRDKFADALKGIISAEEASDYEVIQGEPLVEQSKSSSAPATLVDENELPITAEEAQEIWTLAKENGHVVALEGGRWDVAKYKEALQNIAHAENSSKILRKHYPAMKEWASKKAVQPQQESKPDNLDAEPCE